MVTPRVQDLVRESRAAPVFILYFAAELASASSLAFELHQAFRAASAMQLLGVMLLVRQYYRARRLADMPLPWLEHPRPRLLWPSPKNRSFA
jgi:hypothetical protein